MKRAITLKPPKGTDAKAVDRDNPPWSEEMLGPPVMRRGQATQKAPTNAFTGRMNLFWETRRLTQLREDHLTCFLAVALEVDSSFRAAYEHEVLESLAIDETRPSIARVETQPAFRGTTCRPDLQLLLTDGRTIICEHKLEACETPILMPEGETLGQLERYLELDIDKVAYFRATLDAPSGKVLDSPKYLRPRSSPHFLWRDLYEPLLMGEHVVSAWLREGFEKMGFTPPVPHLGPLWPDDSEEVRQNQLNFGKLWHSTTSYAGTHWKIGTARRCALDLGPRSPGIVNRVGLSPLAQDGTLLRIRVETDSERLPAVRERLRAANQTLPVQPEILVRKLRSGLLFVDQLVSLHLLLGKETDARAQEERLFRQVRPVLDALVTDVWRGQ